MSLIAISDLHLGPEDDSLQADFARFLDFIKAEAESIIINGDLFSFWFGYRDVVPYCYIPTLSKMLELSDSGIRFKYFHGNHDFALGPFFERRMRASIFSHSAQLRYLGVRVHVEHGDLVNREDTGYRLLRRVVRSKLITWLFRIFPPHTGLSVANWCAHISRNYVIGKNTGFYYHCIESAYQRMKSGADLVVYGHGHRTIFSEMTVDKRKKLLVMIAGLEEGKICFLRLSKHKSGLFAFDPESGQEKPLHLFEIASLGKQIEV